MEDIFFGFSLYDIITVVVFVVLGIIQFFQARHTNSSSRLTRNIMQERSEAVEKTAEAAIETGRKTFENTLTTFKETDFRKLTLELARLKEDYETFKNEQSARFKERENQFIAEMQKQQEAFNIREQDYKKLLYNTQIQRGSHTI